MRHSLPLLILLLAFSFSLHSSDFKAGNNIHITEKSEGDIYIAGGKVSVDAPIDGDALIAGGTILINDTIYEDLIAAGGNLYVNGFIMDDIRIAGGDVTISGNVGDDLIVMGGSILVTAGVVVMGDLVINGGEVEIMGTVKGKVIMNGGELVLGGKVYGSVEIKAGRLVVDGVIKGKSTLSADRIVLRDDAEFYDDVEYWQKGGKVDFSAAMIQGSAVFNEDLEMKYRGDWKRLGLGIFVFWMILTLSAFLVVLGLNLLFNKRMIRAGEIFQEKGLASLGVGLLYCIAAPMAVVMLMITVIGFPLGMFLAFFYTFTLLFCNAISGVVFANWMNTKLKKNWGKGVVILVAFGLVVILRLFIFVPIIGIVLNIAVVLAAFGAIILGFGKRPEKATAISKD